MFELHERLAADTIHLADWTLCQILLMTDAHYPWLILVPRRAGIREMHELSPPDQSQLIREITALSQALQTQFKAEKMNVGALGNMVPQLHIHVIARFSTDAAWPRPVWGAVPPRAYDGDELEQRILLLGSLLAKVEPPCC